MQIRAANRSLLKTRVPRLLCGLRSASLLAGDDEMARDCHWGAAVSSSHAPRVGAGEPGASAATRRVEGASEGAAAEPVQGGGGATRGWPPSRIPAASGVSRSD